MKTYTNQTPERQFYIDWLRILLILSVFLFHIGMIFNKWGWHVKNDQQYGGVLQSIMAFLHSWRMPLLFLISGAGTYFALGKRTSAQYLGERFNRLFIPLLVGVFTLVPVQVYIEKASSYSSLLDFYPHMFEGIYPKGNFSWHHLNRDSKFRKLANEAIFPFYLLHQPVIVVVGYNVVSLPIPVLLKVVIIICSSFAVTTGLYWLLIRRINFLRLIFGMKVVKKEKLESVASLILSPVMPESSRSLSGERQQAC